MSTADIESLVSAVAAVKVEDEKDYVYCTTEESVASATAILRAADYVILDSEGQNLGRGNGILSLVCIGTPDAEKVFVFDAVPLKKSLPGLQPLLDLLADEKILKVVWDGRMDYLEMLLTWGVAMKGVLDLQIAEILSREAVRGESDRRRLIRLNDAFFSSMDVVGNSHLFEGLNVVLGMQKCLEQLSLDREFSKDPVVTAMHAANRSDRWMERPLSDRLISYAAQDIKLIAKLYDAFTTKGWLTSAGKSNLAAISGRYVSMFQTRAQSVSYNERRLWTVLPLDILVAPTGTRYTCSFCNRSLSAKCYELNTQAARLRRRPRCRLCHVVTLKRQGSIADTWIYA